MKRIFALLLTLSTLPCSFAQNREVRLTLFETTDVHGNYLPYDFLAGKPGRGSMARIFTRVEKERTARGRDAVVLLDNGDILQGQPSAYYYNFIDTIAPHLCADMLNYMHYDAATVGNHDIETGHAVYDRWAGELTFPLLGANVIEESTLSPYWRPYTIIERQGVKIAVLGMITPGIPMWLPRTLWSGLRFDDMVETARKYMPEMKRKADIVVGLLHSGVGMGEETANCAENASVLVARTVPGFDIVFCGHDHRRAERKVVNTEGDTVWVLNPAAGAEAVAKAEATLRFNPDRQLVSKHIEGSIEDINSLEPDAALMARFNNNLNTVRTFTSEIIGKSETTLETHPAFFGPSAFIDFIHEMQLGITGADISFAAPLSFDAVIPAGDIRVSDMFQLYRYENMLYVMQLTGQEIKDYLEYSYALWTAQMHSADDHMLLFRANPEQYAERWQRLQNPSYNFDSAAGLVYTVDLTQPAGQKVSIKSMADGSPFLLDKTYRCAVNSYRGNGGGELLTKGAHIPSAELPGRIVWSTDKDLRYYLMDAIRKAGDVAPRPLNLWKFIPEDWAAKARTRDELLLK